MSASSNIVRMTRARLGAAAVMRQSSGPIVADGARQLMELERRGSITRAESQSAFDEIVRALRTEVGSWQSPKERRKTGAALERAAARQMGILDRKLLLAEAEHALGRRSAKSLEDVRASVALDKVAITAMVRGFSLGSD